MLPVHFVFIGVAIGMMGTLVYARDTYRGLTQPNRVSWTLWTVAPLLALSSEIHSHADWQWVMTLSVGVGPLIVVIASFANHGAVWKLGPFDVACGLASIVGLIVWLVTANDTMALGSFMMADGLASLPTLRKAWLAPETETVWPYATALISSSLTLATVTAWTSANVAFPVQILLMDLLLVALISGKIGPRFRDELQELPTVPLERVLRAREEK
jgi:hypothetical protein